MTKAVPDTLSAQSTGPVVMGILNVTPDSFSDGGRYADLAAAVAHGVQLHADGAAVVDVGGESTRPGADRIDAQTEIARVLPVIRELVAAGVPLSIDTMRAEVARAALAAGVGVVNDVSGGLADPDMARLVADAGCPWVLMHWRGHSRDMQELARYGDVVRDVRDELRARVDAALSEGVLAQQLILDPGIGFAKSAEHNWSLSARLGEIISLGFPVLVGVSRKSYLGKLLAGPDGTPRPVDEREAATLAASLLAVQAGAWGVRVHDVRAMTDALKVHLRVDHEPKFLVDGVSKPQLHGHRDDLISLRGLRVRGWHGVYPAEREKGQEFVVDAVLELDLSAAAGSDRVERTVHYGELAERLVAIVAGEPVNLIETLAGRLVDACLEDRRVAAATVTVHKPQAPIPHEFGDVSVTLRRQR